MDEVLIQIQSKTVVNSLSSFDSNYVGTYHPWVKILDVDKNKASLGNQVLYYQVLSHLMARFETMVEK